LKNIELRLKTKRGYAFDFTEHSLFVMKIGQKSVFHPHEAHIFALIDITVLYTIILVSKKIRFSSKHKGVRLWFYQKTTDRNKN
jgi:hypothetical protein